MRFRSQLGTFLNSLSLLGTGVEIGVQTGMFSRQILRRWRGQKLWLVDPWRNLPDYLDRTNAADQTMERRFTLARQRLQPFEDRVGWIRETSAHAAKWFSRSSCDFVYIDANHSFQHVRRDLRVWYQKVRPGGLVAGHDYFNAIVDSLLEPKIYGDFSHERLTSYGVKAAVDEFAAELGLSISTTTEKHPTWYFLKPT